MAIKMKCKYCGKQTYVLYTRYHNQGWTKIKTFEYCPNCDKMYHTLREV